MRPFSQKAATQRDFAPANGYKSLAMTAPLHEYVHAGLRIQGHSLAGEETYVIVPELNIAFDFGRAPREIVSIDHVFLSHGHMDHAAGLAYYCSQRLFVDNPPGNIYLPEGLLDPVRSLLRAWSQIDGQLPPANLHVVRPGEDVPVRRNLVVRPFEVVHPCRRRGAAPIQSLGFAAIEVRQKLRDEFAGLDSRELVERKKQGIEITRRVEIPLVTYCGDTAVGGFLDLDHVRKAQVLIIECTFLEDEHLDRARAGCHLHLSDLVRILPRIESECVLLTHLSRRTLLGDARRLLRAALGDQLDSRVFVLTDPRRRKRTAPPPPRAESI